VSYIALKFASIMEKFQIVPQLDIRS